MADVSCGACCGRVILTIVNVLFVIIGLALAVVGILLKVSTDIISKSLGKIVENLDNLGGIINSASIAIIIVGCVILVIGILGCCGACCAIRWMLVAYAVTIIIIVLAEVVGVSLLFTKQDDLKDLLSKELKDVFKSYKDPKAKGADKDAVSRALDGLFISLHCCGFNNSSDLAVTPVTCCKDFSMDAVNHLPTLPTSKPLQACFTSPTSVNSYKDKGCYQALLDLMDDYKSVLIGVGVAILVIELLSIFFAFWICAEVHMSKNKVQSFDN